MTEYRKITQKDVDVIGYLVEATKGTAPTSSAYLPLRGIVQEISWRVDDDRRGHWRSGDGYMASQQTWGARSGSGKLTMKLMSDWDSGDAATTSLLSLALGDDSVGLETVTGYVFTPGTQYVAFTSGGTTEIGVGEIITGGTSGATAIVKRVLLTSGTWAGGDAAGYFVLSNITGTFQAEALTPDYATLSSAQKQIAASMKSLVFWIRQKNLPSDATLNHVWTGIHVKSVTLRGAENGDVELELDFKFMNWSNTAPTSSTLPSAAYVKGAPFFNWRSSDATITFTRAGTEQRIRSFDIMFDRGDLHPIPLAGQRYPCDFAPGQFTVKGNLDFYQNDTELTTIWNTDPNNAKTLAYDTETGTFTAGLWVKGETSGATAYLKSLVDNGTTGTLTLKDIRGQFANDEIITDSSTGSASVNGTLTDTSSIDFELVLSKDSAAQYIKVHCYNAYPTGNFELTHSPQEDAMWMLRYPFEVFHNGNVLIDLKA